jgi:ParB-like chromosome segregation protein Spo0J
MAEWRNRIVGTGNEDPAQLLANPLNYRRHPGSQRDALRGSLNEVGWVAMVTVNRQTGFVVDGHARIEEAISRHEKTVPVLYVDLTPEEERLVLASFDPISAMAIHDQERLNELLEDMHVDDVGLQSLLDSLNQQAAKETDKTAPESPTDEVTCPACGETFAIGVRVKPKPGGHEMAEGN